MSAALMDPAPGTAEAAAPVRLAGLLGMRGGEPGRAAAAVTVGAAGELAGAGLLASSAWLITTASLRPPVLTLTVAIAAVQFFALGRGIARYAERLAGHDLAFRVLARLRVWAFARIEPLVPARWSGIRRGDLLARFVADVDGIQDLYVRAVLPLATSVITNAVITITATLLDPTAGLTLGAGLLIGGVIVPAVTAALGVRGGAGLAARRGSRDALIVEILHGADELAVFGAVPAYLARLDSAERHLAWQARRAALAAGLGSACSTGLPGLIAAAVIAASLPALHAGLISAVTVAVLGFLGFAAAGSVAGLPEAFAALAGTLAGARRIRALADAPPAATPRAAASLPGPSADDASSEAHSGRPGRLPWPGCTARPPVLVIDDVTVSYAPGRRPALDHVSIRLEPGCHLAITGQSGAGKTTLGHLLLRFAEPAGGRLTLDGTDVRDLDPDAVRRLIAWAPQDPHVFHASVAANLRLALPDASDAQLGAALDRAGLGSWLASLPSGLGTILGERGTTISGGERQRLGVTRALLANRPILLLDEPTAHLDAASQDRLRQSVLAAAAGKTLIWITHQHAGLDAFDQVLGMHRGRIAAAPAARCYR